MARTMGKETGTTAEVLAAFEALQTSQGYPPSLRQLGRHLRLSAPTIFYHLNKLKDAGLLTWVKGKSRTLHKKEGK